MYYLVFVNTLKVLCQKVQEQACLAACLPAVAGLQKKCNAAIGLYGQTLFTFP